MLERLIEVQRRPQLFGPPRWQSDHAALADRLLATLREEVGSTALAYDEDGEIEFGYGSMKLFVRLAGDPPSVRIVSPVLRDVRRSPKLLAHLNDLNSRVLRPTFFHASQCVFAVVDLPAVPFERQHVVHALTDFCTLSDGIDELLQAEFGGRTAFAERMPSTEIH